MNKPLPDHLRHSALAFADYRQNTAARFDDAAESAALADGVRVGISRPHESAHLHVTGEAAYVDDLPELNGTLHAALGLSPVARGRLQALDLDMIRRMPGVVAVLCADDIPGVNDCGPVVHDDPILAARTEEIRHLGQPIFAVVAATRDEARRAAARAAQALTIEPLEPVLTLQSAHERKEYVLPAMHLVRSTRDGGAQSAIAAAPHRLRDEFFVGGQEQFIWRARSATRFRGRTRRCWCIARHSIRPRCSTSSPRR
jgi:xanthine dehydrogenase large subunit